MNLLEKLRKEINLLEIKDPLTIARYIYIRTGDLFNYDPTFIFASNIEKERIKHLHVDIENVEDFDLICYSWALMYADLLHAFNIRAEVIKNERHAAVVLEIDGKKFLADLTSENQDITRIKFGMQIKNFHQIALKDGEEEFSFAEMDKKIYSKLIKLEDVFAFMQNDIQFIKGKLTPEQYNYFTFKMLETIMNFERKNVGFVSGVTFINELLTHVFYDCKLSHDEYFFDIKEKIFIKLFVFSLGNKLAYFTYEQYPDGKSIFHQVTYKKVQKYYSKYSLISDIDINSNTFTINCKKSLNISK